MNGIRRSLGFIAAIALIGLALPGYAAQSQNKTYTMTIVCVGTLNDMGACQAGQVDPGVQATAIQLRVTNTSPTQSNSTINSVDLFPDLHWTIKKVTSVYETSQGPGVQYTPDLTTAGHIIVTGLSPIKPDDSLNVTFTVNEFSCGDGSWANSLIWSGSNLGGNTFTIQPNKSVSVSPVACGMLDCLATPDSFFVQPTSTTCNTSTDVQCIEGIRWSYNKDGNACSTVPFYVSNLLNNTDSTARTLHFRWPGESNAVFDYFVNTLSQNVWVSWINDPITNSPIFVPLKDTTQNVDLQCNRNNFNADVRYLPTPYGVLALDVNSSKKILKVNAPASITAPPSFQIVIASATPGVPAEMMLVTNISNGTWTVMRGYGNTTPSPHTADQQVMSTPLPILNGTLPSGYSAGDHAHMCYVPPLAQPNAGTFTTELIDIGDGVIWGR